MLKGPTPMLTVVNLNETLRFYCEVLGFTCLNRMDRWMALRKGEADVMFSLPNEHVPFTKPVLSGSLYFYTDEVDSLWAQFKDKATVVYPLENFFYGMREFAISDNNGYCLQFGQDITDPADVLQTESS